MKDAPSPPSPAALGMLAGVVLGSVASTWLFLATGDALAFVLVGLGAGVGISVGAIVGRRRRTIDRS